MLEVIQNLEALMFKHISNLFIRESVVHYFQNIVSYACLSLIARNTR